MIFQLYIYQRPLKQLFKQVNKILEPLTTLKVNQSNKEQEITDFSLGYNIQLHNLNQIIVESFGLEKIFVIPKSKQKGPQQFGSFKIFYFMMSLFTYNYQFEDEELKQIIQQNQDILKFWNNQGYVFLGQKDDLVKMEEFISALKYIFQEEYIQKLKEILKILCAILKLNYISDLKENNCERQIQQTVQCKQEKGISNSQALEISTNTNEQDENDNCEIDQNLFYDTNTVNGEQNLLSDLILNTFKDLLGVELNNENTPKIKQLLKNYSGNTIVFLLNPNRIIGYAQFLYSKLIQSFFIKVGLASSNQIQQLEQLYKEGQATFLRFPDNIFGGNQVTPFSSNCYIINCQRIMMDYWFEIQKNQIENEKIQYLANLVQEVKKLKQKNDYQSIRKFFQPFSIQKQYSNNILAQINHKCVNNNSNCNTFYEFGDFCQVNKFEIDDTDKQILMTSNLLLLQNQQYNYNEKQSKQGVPSMISELLINFEKVQNNQNKINIYKIDKNNLSDFIQAYIEDIKEQVVLDRRTMKENNALYSDQQNEGSSSDGVSSCDRKSLNQFD